LKTAFAPWSISFGIHLLIIAALIVLNSLFVSGEKLVTIDLTVEDSVNRDAACPEKGTGPEIKNKGPVMKKAAPVVREAKVIDQPKQLPVETKAAPPSPFIAQQGLLTGTEAPAAIPVAANQSSGNNTGRESGKTNITSGQTGTGSSTGYGKAVTGSGSSGAGGESGYTNEQFAYIRELVQKKAFYPKIAEQREWEGQVVVSFVILLDGGVKDIRVVKSSGREILDKSAMEAVTIASPFPRPPATIELKVPVTYKLLLYKN